jgi:transcriptional regulator with GAF, ATPase, and Fis domain
MSDTLKDRIKEMEKTAILNALEECNWVRARAARKLDDTLVAGVNMTLGF